VGSLHTVGRWRGWRASVSSTSSASKG